jgi:flagellar biosynthesis chaperone FliJ
MTPITTEEKLEEELASYKDDLDNIRFKIDSLRNDLRNFNDEMVKYKLLCEQKEEELRRFRLMFPNICKPPTR